MRDWKEKWNDSPQYAPHNAVSCTGKSSEDITAASKLSVCHNVAPYTRRWSCYRCHHNMKSMSLLLALLPQSNDSLTLSICWTKTNTDSTCTSGVWHENIQMSTNFSDKWRGVSDFDFVADFGLAQHCPQQPCHKDSFYLRFCHKKLENKVSGCCPTIYPFLKQRWQLNKLLSSKINWTQKRECEIWRWKYLLK